MAIERKTSMFGKPVILHYGFLIIEIDGEGVERFTHVALKEYDIAKFYCWHYNYTNNDKSTRYECVHISEVGNEEIRKGDIIKRKESDLDLNLLRKHRL